VIICGDALIELKKLPGESIDCCITSPPYWCLRDYGVAGQFGLEKTPEEYVAKLINVFREVRRILKNEGVLWLNLGDSYAGSGKGWSINPNDKQMTHKLRSRPGNYISSRQENGLKPKDIVGIPWRVAFALQADGWYLRQDIIWHKPNPMPESVTDRCTKSHEYIFLMSKMAKYYFDNEAIKEICLTNNDGVRNRDNTRLNNTPGRTRMAGLKTNNYKTRNKRSVWTITTKPCKEAHFATFPLEIPEICIKAGCPQGGVVLDPFSGYGTTGVVAKMNFREFIGIELNPKYVEMAKRRIEKVGFL